MDPTCETAVKRPQIRVPVTAGSLRHGYVTVRDFLWFFPKSAMRPEGGPQAPSEEIVLAIPEVGAIETDIDPDKGIFRWRGWKKFFREVGVREGDYLVITRIDPRHFDVAIDRSLLAGYEVDGPSPLQPPGAVAPRAAGRPARRCNDLSGDEWLRYSVSVWSDIRKTPEEAALKHPAMFPTMLCERLILMHLRRRGKHRILDPFMGSGSTIVAARNLGKIGVGLDVSPKYVALARRRLEAPRLFGDKSVPYELYEADARQLIEHVAPDSIDLCITSPPYWDILNQKRTADYKQIRHYGNLAADLGTVPGYESFLGELGRVFGGVYTALRPGAYCIVVVMDLRKKDRFFPFHADLSARLVETGFILDDMIIWDRGHEYNNLRPLGYPSVFRVNKVHEFILIFRRPDTPK